MIGKIQNLNNINAQNVNIQNRNQKLYICNSCKLPSNGQNYCTFDQNEVDYFVKQGQKSLPYLSDILAHSNNEAQVTQTLYTLDRMIDNGIKGVDKIYPILARFNNTNSPNIQTFLAGIYRKTQVPDAFGPLIKMLIRNSLKPQTKNQTPTPFDPNEEIGGAILSYIQKAAVAGSFSAHN